ncbi:alpha/beta fold hydrolase [Nonomuraea spiralis]|uniref:Alpha/beta fold hydrolase n=1 Tax=Nonomuraea spiralis TaxID=46182 RepID=A0ABV5IA78_9ACTN|nr:alpha/beta fold hydrolase [Nonomuraea spiralis]GGT04775.1 hypothetical protein GCM10010176_056380 [Nonomuraea spiralis]
MFDDFATGLIDVGETELYVRHGGTGSPVLLLHGHPRTHATWHRVAPLLAPYHTVVCPDLRGYGRSGKPPTTPDHTPFSKRAMAADLVALMRSLGHERFAVAGHDRAAGRRLTCPTLFLWAARDGMEDLYGDPLAIWRTWAGDVTGHPIDSGHHMAEEAPDELAAALLTFLHGRPPR